MVRRRASMGVGLLGAVLAASVGASSCADDAVSLFVVCPGAPEDLNGFCGVSADGDTCVGVGRYNLAYGGGYDVGLRLQSGFAARQSDVPLRAETNMVNVRELVVTLRNPAGKKLGFEFLPNPYTLKVSSSVFPESVGIVSAVLVPDIYTKQLLNALVDPPEGQEPLRQIVADVEIRALTAGGEDVVVAPWQWPITLFAFNPAENPKGDECIATNDGVCGIGQDGALAVCSCAAERKCVTAE